MQEFGADAIVQTNAARHVLDVSSDLLGQVRQLVDEGDLGREKRVRRVLDQLGGAPAGEQQGRGVEIQRSIDLAHHVLRLLVLGADDDPVGPLEIADRGALAQEFRIGHYRPGKIRASFLQDRLDLVAGADWDGRLGDDHAGLVGGLSDLPGSGENIGEVGMAVAATRRRADGNKDRVRAGDPSLQVGGERQASGLDVGRDQLVQPRLEYGHAPGFERLDLGPVLVDADHVMAEVGQAGS